MNSRIRRPLLRSTKEKRFLIFWVACYRVGALCTQAKADPCFFSFHGSPFRRHFEWRHNFVAQSILPRASLFVGRVGRFKLYCCLVGKLFCYVVKKFRRCNLSKPEESVCHFWTLYINQNVFCFERFAMFDRTDPLWSQIKSAKSCCYTE